jgi:hypothetical protein
VPPLRARLTQVEEVRMPSHAVHRAAVYTVRVRPKRTSDYRPFGDIDGKGASLAVALQGYLGEFEKESDDETRLVACDTATIDGDDLLVMLRHGQRGLTAEIIGPDGAERYHQTPPDTQLVRHGALFRLPADATDGWLCVHSNHRRGSKGLLMDGLMDRFRGDFGDLMIEVLPCQLAAAFREAVEHDRVQKLKLVRMDSPTDRATQALNKWVRRNANARLELDITSTARLLPALIQQRLGGDHDTMTTILEFNGIHFDQAKVEVELADGAVRTFNIERPESGHPLTEDLSGLDLRDGDPTEASLFAALRAVLADVTG